jgi:GT2 family glycosyltransferase
MQVDVLVPSRNRAQSLGALLDSLDACEFPAGVRVDVYVVNNGSTDSTAAMLRKKSAIRHEYSLIVLEQEQPGKSRALNRALTEARGDLVLILDDDVTVDAHCIAKHIEAHGRLDFAAIQGRVLPGLDADGRSADPQRLLEYNIPIRDFGEEVREIRGAIGTNVSIKREALQRVGPFDERLGPGASGFSEDSEFCLRLRKAGYKIGYSPHPLVYHELNPDRYGRAYQRDVALRQGVSRSLYREDSVFFKVVPNLMANCLRWVWYRLTGNYQKAYKTEGRLFKCVGYLLGKYRPRSGAKVKIGE